MRTVIVALSLAAGCATPADQYRAILPDDRLLIDDLDGASLARGIGEPSEYFQLTRDVTQEVNTGIGDVLRLVDAITDFDPTWTDEASTAQWGPWLDDGIYGQLRITEESDGGYVWSIELRPEDSAEDAWVAVITGHVDPGGDEKHSVGWFRLDFSAIDAMGAGDGQLGQLGAQYELLENGAVATVAFGEISENGSLPSDGGYHYEHTRGEGGLMDLAFTDDISDPPNGTAEVAIVRSRWDGDGAGRADAYVTGGDLGPLTYTESDCWDKAQQTVFFENNFELVSEGDEGACVFTEPSFNESR